MRVLLAYNANPNHLDNQRLTPWTYIFSSECPLDVATQVLQKVPVNSKCKGKTPLHWAAEFGRADIIRLLIDKNADPSCPDDANYSSLQLALKNHNIGASLSLLPSQIKSHSFLYGVGSAATLVVAALVYKKLKH